MKQLKKVLFIITTIALFVPFCFHSAALAQNVLAGVDLWETRPGDATFIFGGGVECSAIPADFFEPGSDPFDGQVAFQGQPLETLPSGILGSADTIVERLTDATLPSCPSSDTVDIQIVALNLVSTAPITVYGMTQELWDVQMCLSSGTSQPIGIKAIDKDCDEGGMFTAVIPVIPKFIFTRVDPPHDQRILDYGLEGLGPIDYIVTDGHWLYADHGFHVITSPGGLVVDHDCDGTSDVAVGPGSNFYPGLQATPCNSCPGTTPAYSIVSTLWQSPDCGFQIVYPPQPEPDTGACCRLDSTCVVTSETFCQSISGTYYGDGTLCLGDGDGDGYDDRCVPPGCCIAPDNGIGTVDLPADCPYTAPYEPMVIIDGLPPGTTIELVPILYNYLNIVRTPGGSLGGEIQQFDATLDLTVSGTGTLAGFNRHLAVPVAVEIHTGPGTPGDPVQVFPADMYRLQGQMFGDPDFCTFIVIGGTDYGLPGPGQTTLVQRPSGDFAVDSFFDITYQIQFVGCPGSVLEGYSGTTTATIRWQQGIEADGDGDCLSEDQDNCSDNYNPVQADTRPDVPNNCGDACECEADLNGDGQVQGLDTIIYKANYPRSYYLGVPCAVCIGGINDGVKCLSDAECPGGDCGQNPGNPCVNDLNCDMEVSGLDTILYKDDYPRTEYLGEPCPPCSRINYPCSYPE